VNEIRWIKVYEGSWHIIMETWDDVITDAGPIVRTMCGIERMWDGTSLETFPPDEKSCESCLRLAAKK
jgi:hypothetical protein